MPHSRAEQFLTMAKKDSAALRGMTDANIFAGEIFGFHAQQSVEKCLKAWIESRGGSAPITHNLILLLTLLEDAGVDVSAWWDLVELNTYAVQYRYEQLESTDEDVDREALIQRIGELLTSVAGQVR